jgi:xylan 1,4-beta-xylosidase
VSSSDAVGTAALASIQGVLTTRQSAAAEVLEPSLLLDFRKPVSRIRALHGVNKGPLQGGGLVDVIAAHRELGVPLTRLHDCHWPNADVVDMHAIFPDPTADPSDPKSYDFRLTDEYLTAIRETGSEILYRLGETIESGKVQRYVHPPKDPARWAQAAIGIIRHYNEGWANGFQYNIRRWEIWNEPETRPGMWTGTDEEFFRFYTIVSRTLKAAFPQLMIGGPGIGITGELVGDELKPSAILTGFLETCRRESLPLDFLSWHCYSASSNPMELPTRAHCIRRLLDAYGFTRAESYLDEWRNIPDYNWAPIDRKTPPLVRRAWYERMSGPEAAAYVTAVLLGLQDAPVEAANFFHGETGGWGLFDESGVPYKNYYGLLAFRRLLDTPERAKLHGTLPNGIAIGAGRATDSKSVGILISNYAAAPNPIRLKLEGLPWPNPVIRSVHMVDQQNDLASVPGKARLETWNTLTLSMQTPSVALITLAPTI